MSSYFANSDQFGGDSPSAGVTHSLDDGYLGPESFSNFDSDTANSSPPIFVSGGDFSSDGPILTPSAEMGPEESYALREWRRQNAIRLEEKEKREKELLSQIIIEAEEYKNEFHKKRQVTCETNRATNREKEKLFLASLEKFHAEADKDYWKSIAELIPKEVPEIKRKGKKEQEKQPATYVVQCPKPGKPTDLARMRQILVKLKHNTPHNLKLSPRQAPDANTDTSAAPKNPDVAASTEGIAVV